jgi:hypothetical protein
MPIPNGLPVQTGLPRLVTRAVISAANTGRDGTGTIVDIASFIGSTGAAVPYIGPNGGQVRSVQIIATGTTTAGMIRLYIHDGTQYICLGADGEIAVTALTPSGTVKAFAQKVTLNRDFPPGSKFAASTHNAETFHLIADVVDY